MKVNKNSLDDLDYIAQLGFEKVEVSDFDLKELNGKIKQRVFSYNNGFYFGVISLIVGVFIGVSVFFMIDNHAKVYSSNFANRILNDSARIDKNAKTPVLLLDTINIVKENFVNPRSHSIISYDTTDIVSNNSLMDSVNFIPSKSIIVSQNLDEKLTESKIKFIINSSIIYIHDYKVSNYTSLYFKKNQYVKLVVKGGLPVAFSNQEETSRTSPSLKQSADYFLHEQLSEALLAFKKGKYDQCIYSFNVVLTYNEEDINCNFYLGMCYYHKKNYTKAVEFFDNCIMSSNNAFFQEAEYYKALSFYESGNISEANKLFKIIADEGEFYSEKVKSFLKN